MEGFLSLEQAAEQLDFSVSELARQIEEGRVVAIVKEGRSWLSAGEVSRLKRQSERSLQPAPAAPLEELRLLRRYPPEASKAANAPIATPPTEPPALAVQTVVDLSPTAVTTGPGSPVGSGEVEAAVMPELAAPPRASESSQLITAVPDVAPTPELTSAIETSQRQPMSVAKPPQGEIVATRPEVEPPAVTEQNAPVPERASGRSPLTAVEARPEPPVGAPPSGSDEKLAHQVRELNKRCAELEKRNLELEATANRLKSGLQETEATLKRNRAARSNLENDVIGLQDQLAKTKSRNEALEREIQRLGAEIERAEETHNSELRRLRSNKAERSTEDRDVVPSGSALADLEALRAQTSEKDRLLAQEYEQRATLRSQLEDQQQKYFELKARYDKEKTEWSELMAQAVQNQGQLRAQLEEMRAKSHPKGWNPFRREK